MVTLLKLSQVEPTISQYSGDNASQSNLTTPSPDLQGSYPSSPLRKPKVSGRKLVINSNTTVLSLKDANKGKVIFDLTPSNSASE